jgi:hypothetical protein
LAQATNSLADALALTVHAMLAELERAAIAAIRVRAVRVVMVGAAIGWRRLIV